MFTKEELQLIQLIFVQAPIQGTYQTLPGLLQQMTIILQKIEAQLKEEPLKVES